MRKSLLTLFSIFAVGCASVPSAINPFSSTTFRLKEYSEEKLSNGMRVLLVEDKSLPYTTFNMLIAAGSAHDPQGFSGLTNFVGEMLKKGTQKNSAIQIADKLENLGSDLEVSTSYDYTTITASGLSFHKDALLDIYSEVITQANFTDPEIQRLKRQTVDSIKKLSERPDSFADVTFGEFLYGSHPYGRPVVGRRSQINSIKKKHVVKHYLQYFRPNNAILAVVGNFDRNILEMLEKSFGSWKPRSIDVPSAAATENWKGLKLEVVNKSDLVQSQVRIGHLGIRRDNPDFIKLRLANTILGGGFASRLMQNVRVKSGLTYGIGSMFDARKDYGPFIVSASTRNEKVGELVKKTISEVEKFRDEGVTEQEVTDAKALLIGTFPRSIETAERLAFNLLILRLYDISDNYLRDYIDNVKNIKVGDVNEVIRKYYQPQNFKILVFSNAQAVKSQLTPLGETSVKNYSEKL